MTGRARAHLATAASCPTAAQATPELNNKLNDLNMRLENFFDCECSVWAWSVHVPEWVGWGRKDNKLRNSMGQQISMASCMRTRTSRTVMLFGAAYISVP